MIYDKRNNSLHYQIEKDFIRDKIQGILSNHDIYDDYDTFTKGYFFPTQNLALIGENILYHTVNEKINISNIFSRKLTKNVKAQKLEHGYTTINKNQRV